MKINKSSVTTGKDGFRYRIEVSVEEHADSDTYPEGVKATFKMIRMDSNEEGETQLVILIDNHRPYGFHSHEKLPEKHAFRRPIQSYDWKEVWDLFQKKCKEILKWA